MRVIHLIPALCLLPAMSHAGLQYSVSSLGSGRVINGAITGLNNNGVVVGTYTAVGGPSDLSFIGHGGTLSALPAGFYPTAINDPGQVVGMSRSQGALSAASYANGQVTPLGDLGYEYYGNRSRATAINNAGQIAGYAYTNEYGRAAGLIYSAGNVTTISSLYNSTNTTPKDINTSGVIAGNVDPGNGWGHGFIYANGTMTDIGTLGGLYSVATAINDSGAVVGYGDLKGGDSFKEYHAFLYSNGTMHDLGARGAQWSQALDISDNGTIIGYWGTGGTVTPFIYTGGVMHAANDLLANPKLSVRNIHAINDKDQIAATVCVSHGDCYLSLLTPVPEPSTYAMLLGGLGVVGAAARRRRRDAQEPA